MKHMKRETFHVFVKQKFHSLCRALASLIVALPPSAWGAPEADVNPASDENNRLKLQLQGVMERLDRLEKSFQNFITNRNDGRFNGTNAPYARPDRRIRVSTRPRTDDRATR